MGSCGTKLQKENYHKHESNTLPTKKHVKDIANKSITFTKPETIETYHPFSVSATSINSASIQAVPLINLRFIRTLFCEDITYEYEMSCNIHNIPKWTLRLTVENLSKFYSEILQKFPTNNISIPYQFGKVMHPKVFTSLLHNILQRPSILKDKKLFFSETTANLLNIPCETRPILQYNAETFSHNANMDQDTFKYYDVISENDDKYKYLCHSTNIYTHDYEYGVIQGYDEAQVTCYSYWVRSLKNKIDFLLNITNNNTFYIIISDLSYTISQILMNNIGIDEHCAWLIADYLPKDLLFNHKNEKCNARIAFKYNNECGSFLLEESGNKLLERHNINVEELQNMCERLGIQYTSFAEMECIQFESIPNDESVEFIEESICTSITRDDIEPILLEMDELVEDKYVINFVDIMDSDNNKKLEIMAKNNYDLSPSNSIDTVVDIDENENEYFPDLYFDAKISMKRCEKNINQRIMNYQ